MRKFERNKKKRDCNEVLPFRFAIFSRKEDNCLPVKPTLTRDLFILFSPPMYRSFLFGALCVAAAAILWGTAGTAQTFLNVDEVPPLWVGALRLVFATMLFLPLLLWREGRNALAPVGGQTGVLVLCCGLAMAAYNLLFFAAMRSAGVAVGTAVVIGSAPVWATFVESLRDRSVPSVARLLGLTVAIAGGVLMATAGRADLGVSAGSLFLCLAAGLAYALYTIMTKRLVTSLTPLRATAQSFSLAMLLALLAASYGATPPTLTQTGLGVTLYLGLCTTGVAYLLFSTGLKHLKASTGVALSLLEPVTAFTLAVTVANERVTPSALLALVLLLSGLFLVLRAEAKEG